MTLLSDILIANNGLNFYATQLRSLINGDNLSDRFYAIVLSVQTATVFENAAVKDAKDNILYDITARTIGPFSGQSSRQFSEHTENPCFIPNDTASANKRQMLIGLQTKFTGVLPLKGLQEDDVVLVQFKHHIDKGQKYYDLQRGILLEKVNNDVLGVQGSGASSQNLCEDITASAVYSGGTPTSVGSGPSVSQTPPVVGGPSTAADILAAYPKSAPIVDEIVALAKKLGVPDPGWLANLINFESGRTFDPSIVNHIGATGLIQFIPSTAKSLGTTTEALAKMTPKEQMVYVEKYLLPYRGKMNNPTDL